MQLPNAPRYAEFAQMAFGSTDKGRVRAWAMKRDTEAVKPLGVDAAIPLPDRGAYCVAGSARATLMREGLGQVSQSQTVRTTRGIQQRLLFPASAPPN